MVNEKKKETYSQDEVPIPKPTATTQSARFGEHDAINKLIQEPKAPTITTGRLPYRFEIKWLTRARKKTNSK